MKQAAIILAGAFWSIAFATSNLFGSEESVFSSDQKPPEVEGSQSAISQSIEKFPSDVSRYVNTLGSYEWYQYAGVLGVTLALLPNDHRITSNTTEYATRYGLYRSGPQDKNYAKATIQNRTIAIRGPTSLVGAIWYTGDGLTSVITAAGFLGTGFLFSSQQSIQVGMQIAKSMLIAGPSVLAIKMATGRESPARASQLGGKWQGYPGMRAYQTDQSRYYAFPSGHVATAVSTLTVIGKNYATLKWFAPFSGIVVTGLMASLMVVGSHWPSDYPLAIMIGYSAGSAVYAGSNPDSKETRALAFDAGGMTIGPGCAMTVCGLTALAEF